jgi:uncharacterized protein (DUF2147 family)
MRHFMMATALLAVSFGSFANSALDGTVWQTIDDTTGKPRAVVEFSESNGALSATVKALLDKKAKTVCDSCSGNLKNKPVVGLQIVSNLKPVAGQPNVYENGTILDPHNGKTYKLKGTVSADGKTLNLRGYIGVSLLGRNQTWKRIE